MTAKQQDMFESVLTRARELKAKRRYAEAGEVLQRALTDAPNNLKIKASLADLFYRTERYREALTLAGGILREDPNDPRALVVMGNVLLERKKPREALEYFRLALDVAETDYLWQRLARCHLDLKEPQPALAALVHAEALAPDGKELLRLLAESARQLEDSATEKETLRRTAKVAPGDPEGFAAFVVHVLQDLPPRRAVLASERCRETPGQETNPHLLFFETEMLLRLKDPTAAAQRLALLLAQSPPPALRQAAQALADRISGKDPP
jgi:tetratricopeptide (TPR) repeat protein